MLINMVFSIMFFMGGLSFSLKRKHLLLMLLSLELMVLSLFVLLIFLLSLSNEYFFSMVFITFMVCESALGLSILVSLMRTHGNDYFGSMSVLW